MKYRVEDELARKAVFEANLFAVAATALIAVAGLAIAHFAFGIAWPFGL
jgi:hypothetical protein